MKALIPGILMFLVYLPENPVPLWTVDTHDFAISFALSGIFLFSFALRKRN